MIDDPNSEPSRPSVTHLILGGLGLAMYLVIGWLYLGSGLVMPYPWVYLMWAVWCGGLLPLGRTFRRRTPWTPVVAIAALAIWIAVVSLGDWLLGWTA